MMKHMRPVPEKQLSEQEFEDVVEQIATEQNQSGVPLEDARAALRELDLPADRLEDAVEKVRAKRSETQARQHTKKRKLQVAATAIASALAVTIAAVSYSHNRTALAERTTAQDAVLSEEPGQLKLSAKLMNAPKDQPAPMTCAWTTPEGKLLHENAWQTKPVNHDAWETHCVLKEAPPHVNVEMRAYGKTVAKTSR
jgi:hypothetical protein